MHLHHLSSLLLLALTTPVLCSPNPNQNILALPPPTHKPNTKPSQCTTSYMIWKKDWFTPDTCASLSSGHYKIETSHPWPTCQNGTEAKFGLFEGESFRESNCKAEKYQLLTKDETLNGCFKFGYMWSFSFWCVGIENAEVVPPLRRQCSWLEKGRVEGC
jgi:hypothetical protein